jgi:hypothetical protein
MAKRQKSNGPTTELSELAGTDLSAHPANFPLGSLQSRAAARALIVARPWRAGDCGTFKCGCTYWVVAKSDDNGRPTGRLIQMIFPKSFADVPVPGQPDHVHDFEEAR